MEVTKHFNYCVTENLKSLENVFKFCRTLLSTAAVKSY